MSSDLSGFDQGMDTSPRVYRTSLATRVLFSLFGAVLIVSGSVCIWYLRLSGQSGLALPEFFCFLFVALGFFAAISVIRSKVVLYADAIELYGFMSVKKLMRHEIEGLRRTRARDGTILELVPSDSSGKPIRIHPQFRTDSAFRAWLSGLPDLDARDQQRENEELAADPLLGSTSDERIRRNAEAKKTARFLLVVALGVPFLSILFSYPDRLMIILTALLPCVAIAMMFIFKGVYRIHMTKSDLRPTLAPLFLVPAGALVLQMHMSFRMLDWKNPFPLAVLCTVVFSCLMFLADPALRSKPKAFLLYALAMAVHGYGTAALANAMFDSSEAQTFKAVVIGKHKTSGKSTSYHLTLAPWGPRDDSGDISVSRPLYDGVQKGEPVCVSLRQGAFHMPWYVVEMCEGGFLRQ